MGDESFPPEADLDAFKQKLSDKLAQDDQTKELAYMWGGFAGILVLFLVALIVFMVLKTYTGSFVSTIPIVVGPCPRGAWIALPSLQTCDYVMCPEFTNGQLAKGFFDSLQDCQASMGNVLYPTSGSTAGVSFAYCTNKPQEPLPSNWQGQQEYTGPNAQSNCNADIAAYNQTLNFGVKCDFTMGPTLCSPADGSTCIGTPDLYADPTNLRSAGCMQYSGCKDAACASFYTNLRTVPEGYSNVGKGTCSSVNPCATCSKNCLVANASNQLAPITATASKSASMQPQSSNSVTSSNNACAANTKNACDSPSDCCAQIATQLNLPFTLAPAQGSSCSSNFNCVADPAATPSYCSQEGGCYALTLETSSQPNANYFSCVPWQSTMSTSENLVFSSMTACAPAAIALNKASLGIKCDPQQGPVACNALSDTGSDCKILSSLSNPPDDLLSSPSTYMGIYGTQLASFPCANRASNNCQPANNPTCAFSTDTTQSLCGSCPIPGNTCTTVGWECTSSDANAGVNCTSSSGSSNTIEQACQSFLGSSFNGVCGCQCLLPGQVCVAGQHGPQILGLPCDISYPGPSGPAPLSAVCGIGHLRSSHTWSPETKTCVKNVSPDFTLYAAPTQTPSPVCPQTAPSNWSAAPSTQQNTLYFLNDPKATQTQTIEACPFSVYNACHGNSPIAPPGPTGSNLPYCSYNAFSGNDPMSNFEAANAMCVMSLINPAEPQYASSTPVCLSVYDNGAKSDYVITGAIDAGAPGSVKQPSAPSQTLVSPNNFCGACSQSDTSSAAFMCPLAPDPSTGFKTLQGTNSFVNTLGNWINYLKGNQTEMSQTGAAQLVSELQSIPIAASNSFVLVPNLYAGLQGTTLNNAELVQTSMQCPNPPSNQGNGILGYCSSTSDNPTGAGQCSSNAPFAECE